MDLRIRVGIAEMAVAQGDCVLEAIGLGSCVSIVIYDPDLKLAGMIHPLLPSSNGYNVGSVILKFMDLALKEVVRELKDKGARNLFAKAAGGASIFPFSHISDIGRKNCESAVNLLRMHQIPLVSSDLGGNYGRSVEFHISSSLMIIKSLKRGTITI